jgi:hypothetical protein
VDKQVLAACLFQGIFVGQGRRINSIVQDKISPIFPGSLPRAVWGEDSGLSAALSWRKNH